MVYNAIGIMSGSALDGLDICYVQFNETGGKWEYKILEVACMEYNANWSNKLRNAINLSAYDYQLLHAEYGHYIGKQIKAFIEANNLQYKVALIGSHGHTTFHAPHLGFTGQIGDGAAIAAETGLPVVSDLRALDVAFGGQGAPIVPIGEKHLLGEYDFFLNLGGIANISFKHNEKLIAFDTSPANRVLNMLMETIGKCYDDKGELAASGEVNDALLNELNSFDFYNLPYPKSLANDFGVSEVYPIMVKYNLPLQNALCTFVSHIAFQLAKSVTQIFEVEHIETKPRKMLVTGGGAFNNFLLSQIQMHLEPLQIEVVAAEPTLIAYKEALIMAFMGVLRWREADNTIATVTGAKKSSIGGALWLGGDA